MSTPERKLLLKVRSAIIEAIYADDGLDGSDGEVLIQEIDTLMLQTAQTREDLIQSMVSRFLGWRLPKDFHPDCGISFTSQGEYEHPVMGYHKYEPVGTNLLNANQAKAMIEHIMGETFKQGVPVLQDENQAPIPCDYCKGTGRVDHIGGTTNCSRCKLAWEAEAKRAYEAKLFNKGVSYAISLLKAEPAPEPAPASRAWVGLSEKEVVEAFSDTDLASCGREGGIWDFYEAVEKKLREHNGG